MSTDNSSLVPPLVLQEEIIQDISSMLASLGFSREEKPVDEEIPVQLSLFR